MATIPELEKLARRMVGRTVKVQRGQGAHTSGGDVVTVMDPASLWPRLPVRVIDDVDRFQTAHEAGHIVLFDREARRQGVPSIGAKELYERYADPLCPGPDSVGFVRFLLNVVEDQLVDAEAAKFVGEARRQNVNRFLVWNRQGGKRPSMAEYEAQGNPGRCAAFVEALFQFATYGELVEAFYSATLEKTAKEAAKAIELYGQGSIRRTQALKRVLDALRKYCPPPWSLPPQYQPPRDHSSDDGDGQSAGSGDGSGSGSGESGQGSGQAGDGQGQGEGSGEGEAGNGDSGDQGQGSAQPSSEGSQGQQGKNGKSGDSSKEQGDESDAGESSEGDASEGDGSQPGQQDGDGKSESESSEKGDEYSESEGSGSGTPEGSPSRGAGSGDQAGDGRPVERAPEQRFEDNNLEALLRMLERVLVERAKKSGRGLPRFRTWSPGDTISSSDEIQRYWEDESFGIDPLKRRVVRQRDQKRHLLAVFIDSSGSVDNALFSQLYRVIGELSEKVAELDGCQLGVGQFSGGASWVLEPTNDVSRIRDFAESEPKRLYAGGTTVGEIYGLLPEWFVGYETADLVVLTDGYVEDGRVLARSLEAAHAETSCEIKLHGVTFRRQGTPKQFQTAKDELPQFVRVWTLGV